MKDLTGQKFNRLKVLHFSHLDKKQNSWWTCECECGTVKAIRGYELTSGGTKSCRLFEKGAGRKYGYDTRLK